jgi:chromosome partitioning protein
LVRNRPPGFRAFFERDTRRVVGGLRIIVAATTDDQMSTILPSPGRTIAVLSQKGGTGKTTLVRTLTDVLRRVGMDVLPIDLDPQGNLSDYFDVDPDASPTIGEVMAGRARAVDALHNGLIPANLGLAEAELVLAGKIGRELTLKRALREARREHDFIVIDCPPALGLLTVNALVAASHALISSEAEYFSLQGVQQALELMGLARENLNEDLDWLGVVLNIADLRTVHGREALGRLRESFGEKVFGSVIRKSVRYPESAERGVSILDYRPELGNDYINLADEFLARLGDDDTRERVGALRAELLESHAGGGGPGRVASASSPEAA